MGGGGGDGPKEEVSFGRQLAVFSVFALGNIGLNYFNSWALHKADIPGIEKGGFKFPFFYTMFHMISSSLAALVLQCTCARPKDGTLPSFGQLWKYKFQLFPIAVCTVLNTAFNNWSLVLVALFINQVIKACAPAVTSLLEFVFLGKVYNCVIYVMVFGICAGSAVSQVSSLGEQSKELILGLAVCTISLFAASAKGVVQKIIMSGTKDLKPLEPTQAIVWDCGISFCIMFVVWIVSDERDESIAYIRGQTLNERSGLLALGIITFGSFLAFMFNIANYYFVHYTSALTMTIGGNGVKVFLLCLSMITDNKVTVPTVTGVAIVVTSICGYAYCSFTLKKPPAPAKTADSDLKQPLATETTPLAAK
jgi:hypothetical protein